MIQRKTVKTLLVIVSSGLTGFYLGAEYVGRLATPDVMLVEQPAWIVEVQSLLNVVLVGIVVSVAVWLLIDWVEHKEETHD